LGALEFWHCPDVRGIIHATICEAKGVLWRVVSLSAIRRLDNAFVLGPLTEWFDLSPEKSFFREQF